MTSTAVILAAGAGSRLGELGKRYSKPMVPVLGRPLIDWVVERLRAAGLRRMIVVAHTGDAALHGYARRAGLETVDQHERTGIADALLCAAALLRTEPSFLACACDSLFEVDDLRRVLALGARHPEDAVVAVQEVDTAATTARSAVVRDGERVVLIVEKPSPGQAPSNVISLPLYLLPHRLLAGAAATAPLGRERYLSTAISDDIAAGGTARWVMLSERVEITTPEDVARAAARLQAGRTA